MSTIPVALQMYTLRNETEKDALGTLKAVAQMGYRALELGELYGMTAPALKNVLDDLGLTPVGMHVLIEDLEKDLNMHMDTIKALGCKFLIIPWMAPARRPDLDGWKAVAASMEQIGQATLDQGVTLCYHNHAFEFERIDGQVALDFLYNNADQRLVQAELDVYWVQKGGMDPASYMRKLTGRLPLLHVKDMDTDGTFAEVGEGVLDWDAIFATAPEAGVQWYVVEQDECKRPPPGKRPNQPPQPAS